MSKETLLATTASILTKHKMPNNALPQMFDAMLKAKSNLNEMLGLNEGNLWRASIQLERSEADVRKAYPQTYAVIGHLLHQAAQSGTAVDLSTISLVQNSVMVKGQPGKMSRLLSRQLKGHEDVLSYCMTELDIKKPEHFLPKLGDIVRSGRQLFVSTNLLDFITASGTEGGKYASFNSCHAPGGCHFNGNLAYGRDKMTVITFVTDDKADIKADELYKVGRSWLFIVGNKIVQTKSYGAYYDFEREAARKFIEEKLAKKLGIENKFQMQHNVGYDEEDFDFEEAYDANADDGEGALYFDNYAIDVSYPASEAYFEKPTLNFAAAMCLECGVTTDNPSKGVCTEHDGKIKSTCSCCGERFLADSMYTHEGQLYCATCYNDRFVQCSHCGMYHAKDTVEVINGYSVCATCKAERYATCQCGKFALKDRMTELNGVGHVCDECLDNYMLCGICGNYHPKDEVEYYRHVGRMCKSCLAEKAFECPNCSEVFLNSDKVGTMCPVCDARNKGNELVLEDKPKYADLPEGWDDYFEIVG